MDYLIQNNKVTSIVDICDHHLIDKRTEIMNKYLIEHNYDFKKPVYRLNNIKFLPSDYYDPILIPVTTYNLIYDYVETLYDSFFIAGLKLDGSHTFCSVIVKFKKN